MENPTKKVSGLKVLLNKPEILQIKEKNVIKEPEFTNCSTCGVEFGKIFTSHKLWFSSIFSSGISCVFLANFARNPSARNAPRKNSKPCEFAIFVS